MFALARCRVESSYCMFNCFEMRRSCAATDRLLYIDAKKFKADESMKKSSRLRRLQRFSPTNTSRHPHKSGGPKGQAVHIFTDEHRSLHLK